MDADELRRRRLALGLTQAQLARHLDVTPGALAHWEQGNRKIAHPTWLDAFMDRLEVQLRRQRPRKRTSPAAKDGV